MHCGDALLIPARNSGLGIPHLWILVTEPEPDTSLCVAVSVTTLRYDKDQTLILNPGDHPFVRKPSIILFADTRFMDARRLEAQLAAGNAEPQEKCSARLLAEIQAALLVSPYTPKKFVDYCKSLLSG